MTLETDLDVTGSFSVLNGLTLNGTATMATNASMVFPGEQTLRTTDGSGQVIFTGNGFATGLWAGNGGTAPGRADNKAIHTNRCRTWNCVYGLGMVASSVYPWLSIHSDLP